MFHEWLLIYNTVEFCLKMNGPFSCSIPIKLEHPGPPFNHKRTGSDFLEDCEGI